VIADLEGRRAVVTGAGAIGSAVILCLIEAGASVSVWDRSHEALAAVDRRVMSSHLVDVGDPLQVAKAAAITCASLGGIDYLVNTAAVATFSTVADMDLVTWQETLDINLTGVFVACQAFLGPLKDNGGGAIVNIASIGGLRGESEFAHYCAAKFGVIGFSQSLAREVGGDGIRVNCVAPGAIESPMNTATLHRYAERCGVDIAVVESEIRRRVALRRIGDPDEVAKTVLFLLSDLSSYVSGEAIAVTGGVL